MKIINLIENTEGRSGCVFAHGLSFYVETEKHRLLMDLGPSEDTLRNAHAIGIDLSTIDTVILSHGHYDHSGGILPFAKINDRAPIYMQESALDDYYSDSGETASVRYKYIGIDKSIIKLSQVRLLKGDYILDDELELFTIKKRSRALPFTNKRILIRRGDQFLRDDFTHEQFLVIRQKGKTILLSGCAHNGILSILDAFCVRYGQAPDLVISGFHLKQKTEYSEDEIREIKEIAENLRGFPTKFATGHCTGLPAFDIMKKIMGNQLQYVHSGEEIDVSFINQK